jgi:hypothetical protein
MVSGMSSEHARRVVLARNLTARDAARVYFLAERDERYALLRNKWELSSQATLSPLWALGMMAGLAMPWIAARLSDHAVGAFDSSGNPR